METAEDLPRREDLLEVFGNLDGAFELLQLASVQMRGLLRAVGWLLLALIVLISTALYIWETGGVPATVFGPSIAVGIGLCISLILSALRLYVADRRMIRRFQYRHQELNDDAQLLATEPEDSSVVSGIMSLTMGAAPATRVLPPDIPPFFEPPTLRR